MRCPCCSGHTSATTTTHTHTRVKCQSRSVKVMLTNHAKANSHKKRYNRRQKRNPRTMHPMMMPLLNVDVFARCLFVTPSHLLCGYNMALLYGMPLCSGVYRCLSHFIQRHLLLFVVVVEIWWCVSFSSQDMKYVNMFVCFFTGREVCKYVCEM